MLLDWAFFRCFINLANHLSSIWVHFFFLQPINEVKGHAHQQILTCLKLVSIIIEKFWMPCLNGGIALIILIHHILKISWGWTKLMWPIPPQKSYLLARNATCSVSFEWHLWRITLTSFHQKKTSFSFGQEVASPSLSVVSHKRNLLISISLVFQFVVLFAIT